MGADPPTLTDSERRVLELAVRTDLGPGEMANHVRDLGDELGMTELVYYRTLDRVLETAAAAAAYPAEVRLLREARRKRIARTHPWMV